VEDQVANEERLPVRTDTSVEGAERKIIKLVIWDLDNTVWNGTLMEGDDVDLRKGIKKVLEALDQRGILHSIASKNEHDVAWRKLQDLGVEEYFLYPQINWSSKAANIESIIKSINIGQDAVAFVDDDPFEREEVRQALPQLLVLNATDAHELAERREFIPPFITEDSARRRQMYRADIDRKVAEETFVGSNEAFLGSLQMKLWISPAQEDDLQRAEELTLRTNQLNSTGYTFSYDELNQLRRSPHHLLLIAGLEDKFGTYGKIGLALVQKTSAAWTIRLLLMSCRVVSRGVGTIVLNHILMLARSAGVRLFAEFRSNGRNRMMLITYKFNGFKELTRNDDVLILEHDLAAVASHPDWVDLHVS
jgi:FkbH-like protein